MLCQPIIQKLFCILNQFAMYITFYLYRYGFVEYKSVAEALNMFNKEENIELDGHTLFINFAAERRNTAFEDGWVKELELDESSKILHIKLKLVEHCIRKCRRT